MPRSRRSGTTWTSRGSRTPRSISVVPSVEWLSTTTTLKGNGACCESALTTASRIVRSRFLTGMTTLASTGKCSSRPGHRLEPRAGGARRSAGGAPSRPAPSRPGSRGSAGRRSRTAPRPKGAPRRRTPRRAAPGSARSGPVPRGGAAGRRGRPTGEPGSSPAARAAFTETATTGPKSNVSRRLPGW